MFCLKCGKEIDNSAINCPYCNSPTENAESSTINTTVITSNTSINKTKSSSEDTQGIIGIILGACSILFAWLIAIFGWICGIAGVIVSILGYKKSKNSKCKIGIIVSGVGLLCSLLSSLIGAITMILMMM